MLYLDTSVLTGYYCQEERSRRVQSVLADVEEPAISLLVQVEFYCAVARKVRAETMQRSTASQILSAFQLHRDELRYRIVPIHPADYMLASEWIGRLDSPLRVLDALHLAVAFSNGLTLLTADRELAECADHLGVDRTLVS